MAYHTHNGQQYGEQAIEQFADRQQSCCLPPKYVSCVRL